MSLNKPEKPPESSHYPPVWDVVIADMQERKEMGKEKYGTYLRAFNGRNALVDAYQEVLDLAVYLRQLIIEESEVNDGN